MGIVGMRETYREGPKTVTRMPTPFADKLIERGMEYGCIDRFPERLLAINGESNDRFGPGCGIAGIARQIPPQDRAALLGQFPRKGSLDPDKSVLNELPYLRIVKRAHWFVSIGRHQNPHMAGQ